MKIANEASNKNSSILFIENISIYTYLRKKHYPSNKGEKLKSGYFVCVCGYKRLKINLTVLGMNFVPANFCPSLTGIRTHAAMTSLASIACTVSSALDHIYFGV